MPARHVSSHIPFAVEYNLRPLNVVNYATKSLVYHNIIFLIIMAAFAAEKDNV